MASLFWLQRFNFFIPDNCGHFVDFMIVRFNVIETYGAKSLALLPAILLSSKLFPFYLSVEYPGRQCGTPWQAVRNTLHLENGFNSLEIKEELM
ncbi:hypothetical protein CFP56_016760 [Quercus suber]|uniref:Uncharacterized protein n=1 Tax=Quercus suber TaxID=58331 RepID=A0AAW0KN10_QUESU